MTWGALRGTGITWDAFHGRIKHSAVLASHKLLATVLRSRRVFFLFFDMLIHVIWGMDCTPDADTEEAYVSAFAPDVMSFWYPPTEVVPWIRLQVCIAILVHPPGSIPQMASVPPLPRRGLERHAPLHWLFVVAGKDGRACLGSSRLR